MLPSAGTVLTVLFIPALAGDVRVPQAAAPELGYDVLFEPFATRSPDGSLYIGRLFRNMFSDIPQPPTRPLSTKPGASSFIVMGGDESARQFHARRNLVCCFLSGHFLPVGEESPGNVADSVLLGVLCGDGNGPDVCREGSWKVKDKRESVWGSVELEMMLENVDSSGRDAASDRWQTKKALQVDMAGPLFAFGEFNAGYNTLSAQEMKMTGGTGIGVKLAAWENGEVSLKGGSQVNYFQDPLRPSIAQSDRSRLLLELACQYAILGPLRLEYSGSASPAMSPLEGSRISQDIRLLLPLGNNSQFRLGAKRNWSDQPTLRAAPDANQLYFGLGLTR
jgi:hypothetical protein